MRKEALALAKQTIEAQKNLAKKGGAKSNSVERKQAAQQLTKDLAEVKNALAAVASGKDKKQVKIIKNSVKKSEKKSDKEKKQVLMLLQTGLKDCPYCKAQCFEKCHKEGHTYVSCMRTCADVGN